MAGLSGRRDDERARSRGSAGISLRLGRREALLAGLGAEAAWLGLGAYGELCRTSDDALDAVIAALTARAKATGRATGPEPQDLERARREGWIVLPTAPLRELSGA